MKTPIECPACGCTMSGMFGTLDKPIAVNFVCGAVWMPAVQWHITCPKAFAVLCKIYAGDNELWQRVINWRPE